jgi:hypothetical protein
MVQVTIDDYWFLEGKELYRKRLVAAIRSIGKQALLGFQNKE